MYYRPNYLHFKFVKHSYFRLLTVDAPNISKRGLHLISDCFCLLCTKKHPNRYAWEFAGALIEMMRAKSHNRSNLSTRTHNKQPNLSLTRVGAIPEFRDAECILGAREMRSILTKTYHRRIWFLLFAHRKIPMQLISVKCSAVSRFPSIRRPFISLDVSHPGVFHFFSLPTNSFWNCLPWRIGESALRPPVDLAGGQWCGG